MPLVPSAIATLAAVIPLFLSGCGLGWRTQYSHCTSTARYRAAVLSNSPLHYFRLQETSTAQPAIDLGSGAANGTFSGTWGFGVASPIQDTGDTAATPNGTSGYFLGGGALISTGFTAESWIKLTNGVSSGISASPANPIMGNFNCGTSSQLGVEGGRFQLCRFDGGSWVCILSTGTVNDGLWHHVVGTHNQLTGAMALWVDGQSAGSGTATYTAGAGATFTIFGRDNTGCGNNQYFSGSLDEIAVYGSVLSTAAIQANYAARLCN